MPTEHKVLNTNDLVKVLAQSLDNVNGEILDRRLNRALRRMEQYPYINESNRLETDSSEFIAGIKMRNYWKQYPLDNRNGVWN